jgi:hypothetical protein
MSRQVSSGGYAAIVLGLVRDDLRGRMYDTGVGTEPSPVGSGRHQGHKTTGMNEEADFLVAYLRGTWGIPLGTAGQARGSPLKVLPSEIVRRALDCGDLRLVRALPLWLSLLPHVDPPPDGWSVPDRRRLAYLCELAQALASLRNARRSRPDASWAASVARIQPEPWGEKVTLCRSSGPVATPSVFGELWGIEEPMTFPEYVAFQDQFLALKKMEKGDAARARADRRGPAEADPALR